MAWFRMMGVDSVDYHRRTVAARADDHPGQALAYYGTRGETPLRWGGLLAARLGLDGAVDDDAYEAIFGPGGAHDPHLDRQLVRTTRPGVELVVAAHKSVAVLGLLGRADDMHAILDAETDATLDFLERWFAHQGGRRGRAQVRTRTGGLLWARTRHATSRAGDPAPHDHVLIANLTEMHDHAGGWKALDTGAVRDLLHAATMVGRLAAAQTAVELGYAIEPDHGPSGKLDHWAIAGIPSDVVDLFSKRAADIDAALEAEGFGSYRARGIAARDTRDPKTDQSPESLLVRWLGELHELGWPAPKINQRLTLTQNRARPALRHLTDAERGELVGQLLGPAGPLAQRKAFTRPDVIRHAVPLLYGCPADELNQVVAGVVHNPEAIPLVGKPSTRGRAWTPASVLTTEYAVEAVANRLATLQRRAAIDRAVVRWAIAAKEATLGCQLTEGQRQATEAIATSGRGLDLVIGVAGSGKTTALDVARTVFEAERYRVLGTAVSGQAARTLHDEAGVDARTVASLVWRVEHCTLTLDERTVLLIDEAGMADDQAMLKLLTAVEVAGAKAVVMGDHHQLGAVGPGGGLEALVNRHHPAVHVLDDNIRQHDPAERQALEHLRAGDVNVAVDYYRRHHRIVAAPARHDALDLAVDAWHTDRQAGRDSVLLAWRRRDVAELNHRARQRWLDTGYISGHELEAPGGRRYATGDRVVTLAPSGDGRFVTSERATVLRADTIQLTVRFDDGRQEVLAGDQLGADRLDYAYAVTVHRMQGATVDQAHVIADGDGRELAYVAMSRARDTSHIYVVADDLDQAADDLRREWGTERRQRWILDTDTPALEAEQQPSVAAHTCSERPTNPLEQEPATTAEAEPEQQAKVNELSRRLDALQHRRLTSTRGLGIG